MSAGVKGATVVTRNGVGRAVVVGPEVSGSAVMVVASAVPTTWSLTSPNSYTPAVAESSVSATMTRCSPIRLKQVMAAPTSSVAGSVQA